MLRRGGAAAASPVLVVGGLRVDARLATATLEGRAARAHAPRVRPAGAPGARGPATVVTKRELLADVWHSPYGGADKTVDVHLSWLRRKLGESAAAPRYLHSVRGVGVKLVAPDGGRP